MKVSFAANDLSAKRDGVCNPVTHVSKTIKTSKRFSLGCKPRPAEGEYWVSAAVVVLCFGLAMATRNYGQSSYAPFFTDWAGCYKSGLCSAAEWKSNRLRFF